MRLSLEGDQKFLEYSKSSTEASCIASVLWKEQESSLLSPDCHSPTLDDVVDFSQRPWEVGSVFMPISRTWGLRSLS